MPAVVSHRGDIAMIDLEQQFWPYFFPRGWKCFALWVHVILTLEDVHDGQDACAGTKRTFASIEVDISQSACAWGKE